MLTKHYSNFTFCVSQTITPYALNLYSDVRQLYHNKTERNGFFSPQILFKQYVGVSLYLNGSPSNLGFATSFFLESATVTCDPTIEKWKNSEF